MVDYYGIEEGKRPKLLIGQESNCYDINLQDVANNSYEYDPELVLESNEWYYIEYDERIIPDYLRNDDIQDLNIDDLSINDLKFIWIKDNEENIDYFIINRKNKRIDSGLKLFFGWQYIIKETDEAISLNNEPDGIYSRDRMRLYLKKIESLNFLFDSERIISSNATNEEVKEFLNNDFINLNNFRYFDVGQNNRKRVKIAMQQLDRLSTRQKRNMVQYIAANVSELKYNKNRFTISNDNELKLLLYGINQRYYDLPITGEHVIATSILRRN